MLHTGLRWRLDVDLMGGDELGGIPVAVGVLSAPRIHCVGNIGGNQLEGSRCIANACFQSNASPYRHRGAQVELCEVGGNKLDDEPAIRAIFLHRR